MSRAGASVIFTSGFVALAAGVMAISIFGFGQFEPMWGPWPSFQVALWLILGSALFVVCGFWWGASSQTQALPSWWLLLSGAVFTLLFAALVFLVGYLRMLGLEQSLRLMLLSLLGFLSSFVAARLVPRVAAAANLAVNRTCAKSRAVRLP